MKRPIQTLLTFSGILALALTSHAANLYTSGHGDIGVAYEDGALFLHGHLGANAIVNGVPVGGDDGEEFLPGDFTIVVPAGQSFPDPGGTYGPTGAGGGDLWILPQTQVAEVPFLGMATEELDPADWVNGAITFSLVSVSAPGGGEFSMWQSGLFGDPVFVFSTFDPGSTVAGNSLILSAGTHAHYNFGFTKPGIWEVTFTVSGTHVTDGFVSDTGTFRFAVVPEPTVSGLAISGGLGALAAARRRRSARRPCLKR